MRRRQDALLLAVLAVLPVLFHWRVLTPNALDRGSFPPGDFADQFYAFARFAAGELEQGRLPLWNPYTYAGHPFLADVQSALFYPPSLVLILASRFLGGLSLYLLEWLAVLHFSLAGIFTFLFARHEFRGQGTGDRGQVDTLDASPVTPSLCAFLTAIVFTFGGYLTGYPSQQLAILQTDVWLPLILLCLRIAFEDNRRPLSAGPRSLIFAGLFFGVALLAGHPQSAMYLLIASTAYAVFRGRQHGWKWGQIMVRLALVLAVALALSAVQWLPSLEYMALSSRANLSYADFAGGLALQDPLQMLLPGLVSFYSPLYVGIAPLVLAIAAMWLPRRRPRATHFWVAVALGALLLAFGGNLFFYPVFYLLAPGFALFRQQERAAFLFSFGLALLAGYGALHLTRPLLRDERRRFDSLWRLVCGAVLGAMLFFLAITAAWMSAGLRSDSAFQEPSTRAAWLVFMLALVAGLLLLRHQGALGRTPLLLVLAGVTALDLFMANWHTNFHAVPPEQQTRMPSYLAQVVADHSQFRTFNEHRLPGNFGDVYRVEDTWGASPLRLAHYEQFMKLPMERIWALLNVKYVITWRQSLSDMGVASEVVGSERVSEKETTYVHRLLKVAPRAVLVTRIQLSASESDTLSRLAAPDFDFRERAVLEAGTFAAADISPVRSGRISTSGNKPPALFAQTANGSSWEVRPATDALFVLNQNYYPGWRAVVDGREAPVLRANSVMTAVPVPAGAERVELVFDPASVKAGLVVSALGLGSCLALLAIASRKLQDHR